MHLQQPGAAEAFSYLRASKLVLGGCRGCTTPDKSRHATTRLTSVPSDSRLQLNVVRNIRSTRSNTTSNVRSHAYARASSSFSGCLDDVQPTPLHHTCEVITLSLLRRTTRVVLFSRLTTRMIDEDNKGDLTNL